MSWFNCQQRESWFSCGFQTHSYFTIISFGLVERPTWRKLRAKIPKCSNCESHCEKNFYWINCRFMSCSSVCYRLRVCRLKESLINPMELQVIDCSLVRLSTHSSWRILRYFNSHSSRLPKFASKIAPLLRVISQWFSVTYIFQWYHYLCPSWINVHEST